MRITTSQPHYLTKMSVVALPILRCIVVWLLLCFKCCQAAALPDLVAGYARGLSAHDIAPWLLSIKRFMPKADVLLLGHLPPVDVDTLTKLGAMYEEHLPANKNAASQHRMQLLAAFLTQQKNKYSLVASTDVRDVIFQRDIFATDLCSRARNEELVFLGEETMPAGDHGINYTGSPPLIGEPGGLPGHTNYDWLKTCYGHATAESMIGKPILNSGFIVGKATAMAAFYTDFYSNIRRNCPQHMGYTGIDQGVANHLAYKDSRSSTFQLIRVPNGELVLNVGVLAAAGATFPISPDMHILHGFKGSAYPAIHQYDRFSKHQNMLRARYHILTGQSFIGNSV